MGQEQATVLSSHIAPPENEGQNLVGSLVESWRYGLAIGSARRRAGAQALDRPRAPTLNPTLTLITHRALTLARWGTLWSCTQR